MQSIAAQLHAAMVIRGWSVPRLLKESKLRCTRISLYRKLQGQQKLSTGEAEKLARALDVTYAMTVGSAA
jgi:hypothetical protein